METYALALAVVRYADKYLIGKRAVTKRFAQGKWEFISGFIDSSESAEKTIARKMFKETNLSGTIIQSGYPYILINDQERWIVAPFLVEAQSNQVRLNGEDHEELRWVNSEDLDDFPDLKHDVQALKARSLIPT